MKPHSILRLTALAAALLPMSASAQFFGDPPDETHPWAKHDPNRPQPAVVTPGEKPGDPPSDAIVLFDGTEESFKKNWTHDRPDDKRKADWVVEGGAMQSMKGAGYAKTKAEFGDCQLHIEWKAPEKIEGDGQGRGNSGVFLMGIAEVQVLDNYDNPTYPDGTAGAVYGVMPPMVNALRPPGEWQSYDIIFRRPIEKDGVVVDEGSLTVFLNGVLVQDATPLEGGGGYRTRTHPKSFGDVGPLKLQDHGNPVRYRNIWYREIRKRPVDGGTDGRLSPEATMAKRAEIAADILKNAAGMSGNDKMLRMLESLCYKQDEAVLKQVSGMADAFVKEVLSAPAKLPSRKDEIVKVYRPFRFMQEQKLIPADLPAYVELDKLMIAQGWKKGK